MKGNNMTKRKRATKTTIKSILLDDAITLGIGFNKPNFVNMVLSKMAKIDRDGIQDLNFNELEQAIRKSRSYNALDIAKLYWMLQDSCDKCSELIKRYDNQKTKFDLFKTILYSIILRDDGIDDGLSDEHCTINTVTYMKRNVTINKSTKGN